MATTTKSTTVQKKSIAPETETKVETTSVETKVVEEVKKVATPKKFAQDELILCRSVCGGELLFPSKKSGQLYVWSNFGDTCEVEFQDLQSLKSTRSPYLYKPFLIIENEELLEQWGKELQPIYDAFVGIDDINAFFALPNDEFKSKVQAAPEGIKNTIKVFAAEKILNGTLDSINKINILDEVLDTDLKHYIK